MSERGARPKGVPAFQRRAFNAMSAFFTPLLPDDYLEMINPLWSTEELRGKIEKVEKETEDTVTITIKPGWQWDGHNPGQYVRIGFVVDGVHHWRAYSLTSDPDAKDGRISITPKLVEEGKVTPYLVEKARPGVVVRLGEVEGTFTLPEELPEKMLFISAGSGITPIMSMLRSLDHHDEMGDVVHIHSAQTEEDIVFGKELQALADKHEGFKLHKQLTSEMGRFKPEDLEELVPDWKKRMVFASGPGALLDDLSEYVDEHGDCDQLFMERFQPIIGGDGGEGEGGSIKFLKSDTEAESDGSQPILVAGEEAGLELPFGCRMGVCHTCIGKLCSGRIRDLRTGEVKGDEGEMIRTCIHAPEGPIEIEL